MAAEHPEDKIDLALPRHGQALLRFTALWQSFLETLVDADDFGGIEQNISLQYELSAGQALQLSLTGLRDAYDLSRIGTLDT